MEKVTTFSKTKIYRLLKCLYVVAKIHGLLPINFFQHPTIHASKSRILTVYSIVVFISFESIVLKNLDVYHNNFYKKYTSKKRSIVLSQVVEMGVSSLCTIICYLTQILNRNSYISLINEFKKILANLKVLHISTFLDNKCRQYLIWKTLFFIIQITMIFICIISIPLTYKGKYLKFRVIAFSNYTNIIFAITSSLYFCGMLVSLQFYRYFNLKLKQLMFELNQSWLSDIGKKKRVMRVQYFCAVSDEIDCMAKLYWQIHDFTNRINNLFRLQLVANFSHSSTEIIFEVTTVQSNT